MTDVVQDGLELSLGSNSKPLGGLPSPTTRPPPRSLLGGPVEIQAKSSTYKLGHRLVLLPGELLHLLLEGRRE